MEKYHEDPDPDYKDKETNKDYKEEDTKKDYKEEESKLKPENNKNSKRKIGEDSIEYLYKKHHPNEDIKYYEFYNKFRDEFFSSIRKNFSEIIIKYELDENFIFENKNLLGHLACYCKKEQISFFKRYFKKEQLEHMANYVNCLGNTVFHYSVMQINNIEMLQFLFTLSNYINEEDVHGDTPMDLSYKEYSREYVMKSYWGKLYVEKIRMIPKDIKQREPVQKISDMIGVNPFYVFIKNLDKEN